MDKSELPLSTAVEHYLTACRTEGKTPKTLFDYEQKLYRFLDWQNIRDSSSYRAISTIGTTYLASVTWPGARF